MNKQLCIVQKKKKTFRIQKNSCLQNEGFCKQYQANMMYTTTELTKMAVGNRNGSNTSVNCIWYLFVGIQSAYKRCCLSSISSFIIFFFCSNISLVSCLILLKILNFQRYVWCTKFHVHFIAVQNLALFMKIRL